MQILTENFVSDEVESYAKRAVYQSIKFLRI